MRPTGVPIESRMLPCMPERTPESIWEGRRQHRASPEHRMQHQKPWKGDRPQPHMHRNCVAWKAMVIQQWVSQRPALPGSKACAVTWAAHLHRVAEGPVPGNADSGVAPGHHAIRHKDACRQTCHTCTPLTVCCQIKPIVFLYRCRSLSWMTLIQ